jgi:hypothetical protein
MAISYSSNFNETVPFSDVCAQVSMTINSEQTVTVPGNATTRYQARFTYTENSNVFVSVNATPVVPPAGTTGSQQYSEFRPGSDGSKRYVSGGDVIHFITPDATGYAGVCLKQLPG